MPMAILYILGKQNDAEDIFVHPGDANRARVKGTGDQTRPQWVGSSAVLLYQ